jgi:DNA mismatch repair protein MutL
VLHLSIPFDEVDVNVHPQKSEVRFLHPDRISAFVRTAVERALDDAGLRTPSAVFDLARKLSVAACDSDVSDRRRLPLGRVILERLKAAIHGGDEDMVKVNPPVIRELSSMQAAVFSQNLETIRDLGFSARLSGDTAVLDGYPGVLAGCVPAELFDHLVDICLRGVAEGIVGEALWETLATAACKAAIKAGDALDPERADRLLREIEAVPNAAQCNHGRPTMIFMKHEDIARMFGR